MNKPTIQAHDEVGREFAELYRTLEIKYEELEAAWIKLLRAQNVKAAHPDDGWVDRALNRVILTYPYFIEYELKPNDLIVLGCPDNYRYVRIIEIMKSFLFNSIIYYKFMELPEDEQNLLRSPG